MHLLLVGINHKRTPIEVREQLAFSSSEVESALAEIRGIETVDEVVLLSTCNRTEIIAAHSLASNAVALAKTLRLTLCRLKQIEELSADFFFHHEGTDAVNHLFRVTSGLESMVIGEPQILGQVKQAYKTATHAQTAGFILNKLFHRAFRSGKRVRTETELGVGSASVSHAAAMAALNELPELPRKKILLVGAGEMIRMTAGALRKRIDCPIVIVNRSLDKAEDLAVLTGIDASPWEEIESRIAECSVIITATGAREPVILASHFNGDGRKLVIDIGVPRNVEPTISELPNIHLMAIDDLREAIRRDLKSREDEIPKALAIIEDEVSNFMSWYRSLVIEPTIKMLIGEFDRIRQAELKRVKNRFGDDELQAVDELTNRIVKKLLHQPIRHLKNAHRGHIDKSGYWIEIVRQLFDLEESPE